MSKPEPLEKPDFTALIELVQDYFDFRHSDDYDEDNDYAEYIYEEAVMAVYGREIWDYLNDLELAEDNE